MSESKKLIWVSVPRQVKRGCIVSIEPAFPQTLWFRSNTPFLKPIRPYRPEKRCQRCTIFRVKTRRNLVCPMNSMTCKHNGAHYQELELQEPHVWIPELDLGLGLWQGKFQGIERLWLRWYDAWGFPDT